MSRIEVENLIKSYDGERILNGISFQVGKGEIVGLLGSNGAGKSTTVKLLTGQEKRDSGKVRVMNSDPEKKPVKIRKWSGILPERQQPPAYLKVSEYFQYISEVRGESIDTEKWLDEMELKDKEDKLIKDLSKGEQQKLIFIQAVFHEPELLFVDEPMINLDPFIQNKIKEKLQRQTEKGASILLSTHIVPLAEELCDRVLILDEGRLEKTENVENLDKYFLN